jgi:hypothetical protein
MDRLRLWLAIWTIPVPVKKEVADIVNCRGTVRRGGCRYNCGIAGCSDIY